MTHVSDDELHNGQLLGIGEASQLCGITSRTLRHYDKLNLLQPDRIGDNKYRYYSLETILRIPIINYLKMMGFSLDEVSELFETKSFDKIKGRPCRRLHARNDAPRGVPSHHSGLDGTYRRG